MPNIYTNFNTLRNNVGQNGDTKLIQIGDNLLYFIKKNGKWHRKLRINDTPINQTDITGGKHNRKTKRKQRRSKSHKRKHHL